MTALIFHCIYTIYVYCTCLTQAALDSCTLIGPPRPTSTTGGPKQTLSSTFLLSLSRLCLLASLAAVFSSPSPWFFPDFQSFPLPLLLPYQLSEDRSSYVPEPAKGLRWEHMDGWWNNGSALQTAQTVQYLMQWRWQQNTQSLLNR